MNPARKRQVRLIVSLTLALALGGGLIYTSFSAADPALTPTQLLTKAKPGVSYELTGTVVAGSVHHLGDGVLDFRLADRAGGGSSVPVSYTGAVPDPFRVGRELIVTVNKSGEGFVGQPNSMITKCPSKYVAAPNPKST
jgi:cytochrome c-type biogenesis protein CcmE